MKYENRINLVSISEDTAFANPVKLISMLFLGVLFMCGGSLIGAEDAAMDNPATTITTDFGWCILTSPKTCIPGKVFELKFEFKNLKEVSRNWEADKLAVHLFWSGKGKGGYLIPFGSAGVSKDGTVILKGKFNLNDKISSDAEYVSAKVVLTSDWAKQDENKAADFIGPKIEILKDAAAIQKEPAEQAKNAGTVIAESPVPTTSTDFGWCVLTCPKTCGPGKPFELKFDLKNLKEISRNWEADKLAVHLLWSGKGKGGYLGHFGSVEVKKDGVVAMKGKFSLTDKIRADVEYVSVKAVLTSDWAAQDENKATDLMGPKIEIVKEAK
jgi:hypothetical protein